MVGSVAMLVHHVLQAVLVLPVGSCRLKHVMAYVLPKEAQINRLRTMKIHAYTFLLGFVLMFMTRQPLGYHQSTTVLYMAAVTLYALASYWQYQSNKMLLLLPLFLTNIYMFCVNSYAVPRFAPTEFIIACIGVVIGVFARKKGTKVAAGLGLVSVLSINIAAYYLVPYWEYYLQTRSKNSETIPSNFVLLDQNKKMYTLADLEGKTVFLDFWSTACGACIMNFPNVEAIQQHYKNNPDVFVFFVNTGYPDSFEKAHKFIQKRDLQHLSFMYDEGNLITKALKITYIPQYFILKNGVIYWHHKGTSTDEMSIFTQQVIQEIDKIVD